MLISCKGIVLRYFKASQNAVVVKILTQSNGLVSFFVKNTSSKKTPLALLQPVSLIALSANSLSKNNLYFLNEISLAKNINPLSMNLKFFFVFLAEVLVKVLREEVKDHNLFNYVWGLVVSVSKTNSFNKNLPILFLVKLSEILGFSQIKVATNSTYFDLENASFTNIIPCHKNIISGPELDRFKKLLLDESFFIEKHFRNILLNSLLLFYQIHGHELKNLNSHIIIKSL